jgi:hypothetical protein
MDAPSEFLEDSLVDFVVCLFDRNGSLRNYFWAKFRAYCLQYCADIADKKQQESITKDIYELINKRGEIYITSSVVGGTYLVRVVSANPLAEEKYLREAFDILVETAEGLSDGKPRTRGLSASWSMAKVKALARLPSLIEIFQRIRIDRTFV